MEKFVVIDGNAILHRAFHALPLLTSRDGQVVNAVYGFFSMFLKILQELKPKYIVVCFDKEKPTFRQSLFVGYQAKRPKMADELVPQIGIVHDVLQKAKISIFEVDGYEADDLIGTLANQVQSSKFKVQSSETIIVSGDRDMLQLVNSYVKVLAPVKGITEMILFDEKKVEEKYGIKPLQIIDYKALVGDASDNYPGVKGIGPKTAASLLKEYGSFENMYKAINSLPPKISEKLATDAEQAALAKKLATIVTDAPIKLKLDECSMDKFSIEGARRAFEELGFKSLLKRLENGGIKEENGVERNKDNEQLGLL